MFIFKAMVVPTSNDSFLLAVCFALLQRLFIFNTYCFRLLKSFTPQLHSIVVTKLCTILVVYIIFIKNDHETKGYEPKVLEPKDLSRDICFRFWIDRKLPSGITQVLLYVTDII